MNKKFGSIERLLSFPLIIAMLLCAANIVYAQQSAVVDDIEQAHDFADPATDDGQRRAWHGGASCAFELEKGEGHGRQHDVMRPAAITAAFEVIESEVSFSSRYCGSIGQRLRASVTKSVSEAVASKLSR